jgi:SAM-dependent methyltransferase
MYECDGCRVVFFDRRLFEVHSYGNYYDYTEDWDDARIAWEMKIRRKAFRRQFQKLGRYVEGRRLLDIGAGAGFLCRSAIDAGWDAQGIELSPKAVSLGQKFLDVKYVDLDDVADGSLDVITCYHILEHMEQPSGFIKTVSSKLKANGVVAVHVPHREPLSFSIRNRLQSRGIDQAEKLCQLYVPEHISGFTKESLVNSFQIFGFRPLLITTCAMWSSYYDPFFLANYLREKNYAGLLKHTVRSLIDNVGVAFGQGDWVVGHFRKT